VGGGGAASRAVQSSGKVVGAAGGECKEGKAKELPKYMLKLNFLKDLRRTVWPRVEPVLNGARVKGLEKMEREKRLHMLVNEYLRVYCNAGEKGQEVAIRKAVQKEKKIYTTCAKRGDKPEDYQAKFSNLMKTAKETKPRTEATEFSDDEEDVKVEDVEAIARKNILEHLTKVSTLSQQDNVDWTADWTCRKCKALVWAKHRDCYKCQAPRLPLAGV